MKSQAIVIGGKAELNGNIHRIIFDKKNKKRVLEEFGISQYTYKNFFCQTGNQEECQIIENDRDNIYIKEAFNNKAQYEIFKGKL